MLKRILDWAGYVGLTVLVGSVLLPYARPQWLVARWWIVLAGVLLVLASLVAHAGDPRGFFGRRTTTDLGTFVESSCQKSTTTSKVINHARSKW